MRLAGTALLTAAGLLAGIIQAQRLRDRAERRAEICRMLDRMEFELDRFRTPLPALFERLAEQLEPETAALCKRIAGDLAAPGERDLAAIWAAAVRPLPSAERRILAPLGGVLGRYGAEEQVRALASCARDMERARDEARREAREKGRLWVGLSTACAGLAAVLLI